MQVLVQVMPPKLPRKGHKQTNTTGFTAADVHAYMYIHMKVMKVMKA